MISLDITSNAGGIRFSMIQKQKSHPGPLQTGASNALALFFASPSGFVIY